MTSLKREAIQVNIDRMLGGLEDMVWKKQYKNFMGMSRSQKLHHSIKSRNRRGWQIIQMTAIFLIFLGTYKFS